MQELVWLLVLVTPNDLVEDETFASRAECLQVGARYVDQSSGGDAEPHRLNGFFCEPQEPERAAQEIPKCTDPIDQCA